MKTKIKQIEFVDQILLPIFGIKSVIDYSTKISSRDINKQILTKLNNILDEIKEILISFRENSKKEAQNQLDLLARISDRVTSWKIVREAGQIAGHDHLVQDKLDNRKSRMNAIYATSDAIRDSIMDAHVRAAKASGIQFISNFFFGPSEQMDEPYRKYGFEISDLYTFERQL